MNITIATGIAESLLLNLDLTRDLQVILTDAIAEEILVAHETGLLIGAANGETDAAGVSYEEGYEDGYTDGLDDAYDHIDDTPYVETEGF